MEKEMKYVAPEVDVLEVRVEAGYDLSGMTEEPEDR